MIETGSESQASAPDITIPGQAPKPDVTSFDQRVFTALDDRTPDQRNPANSTLDGWLRISSVSDASDGGPIAIAQVTGVETDPKRLLAFAKLFLAVAVDLARHRGITDFPQSIYIPGDKTATAADGSETKLAIKGTLAD
jgi:hypothetical protein